MYHHMFKAHDIRSVRESFTGKNGKILVDAIAFYMQQSLKISSIILARDARIGGNVLMELIINNFTKVGINVLFEPNPIGSCQFYHACMLHPKSAGIMITASHNPGSYLGMKLVGTYLSVISMGTGLEKIAQAYEQKKKLNQTKIKGSAKIINTHQSFIDYSMSLAQVHKGDLSGLTIVCDFLNGSSGASFMDALAQAGAKCIPLHPIPNGNFPLGDPNPGINASMESARMFLKNNPFSLLFAYDGDGDRMDLLVHGIQLSPSFVMYSIVDQIKKLNPTENSLSLLLDVKASPIVLSEIAKKQVQVQIVRNGHSAIKRLMQTSKEPLYLCASEESAHYYYQLPYNPLDAKSSRVAVENTLFYTLLILKAYKENPQIFDKAQKLQKSFYRKREWSITVTDPQTRNLLLETIEKQMSKLGAQKYTHDNVGNSLGAILYRKGIEIDYKLDSGWFQLFQRISESEESLIRFEVLAQDNQIGKKIVETIIATQNKFVSII